MLTHPEVPELLLNICVRWIQKHPGAADRLERARLLVMAGAVEVLSESAYLVQGSQGRSYLVSVRNGYPSCQCRDYLDRGVRCKHQWASALYCRLATELEDLATQETPKPSPKKPLTQALGAHCKRLQRDNQKRLEALPVAPVIPIKK